jgi:hypothetical protein
LAQLRAVLVVCVDIMRTSQTWRLIVPKTYPPVLSAAVAVADIANSTPKTWHNGASGAAAAVPQALLLLSRLPLLPSPLVEKEAKAALPRSQAHSFPSSTSQAKPAKLRRTRARRTCAASQHAARIRLSSPGSAVVETKKHA